MEGLEPTHLSALDPKSSVSTNFTTSALSLVINHLIIFYFNLQEFRLILFKLECKDIYIFNYTLTEIIFFSRAVLFFDDTFCNHLILPDDLQNKEASALVF